MKVELRVTLDIDETDPHVDAARGIPRIAEQVKRDVLHLLMDIGYARGITVECSNVTTRPHFRTTNR